MYLSAVIDAYTRKVMNWSVSNSMQAKWCKEMIEEAIGQHGKLEIINTDQGIQCTSYEFSKQVINQGVKSLAHGWKRKSHR